MVVQRRTQRLNRGGAKSHSLEVTQTIFVLTFNTWFLRMAVAVQYGSTNPSLGDPLLGLQLRAFYLVDGSSMIVQAIETANFPKFRQLLVERKATPFDTVMEGYRQGSQLFS